MRAFLFSLVLIASSALAGCSMPDRILIRNNSPRSLTIKYSDGKAVNVPTGRTVELAFDHFFLTATVTLDGVRRIVEWKAPPAEFFNKTKYPPKFGVSLEPDGKFYALDIGSSLIDTHLADPQPNGFPLLSY